MPQECSPIIKPQELILQRQSKEIVLLDARTGPGIVERYSGAHLEGALFVDLENQLADKKTDPANGGRHPLPDPDRFIQILTQLGISPDSHVVVYDDKNGSNAAARLWWMLKSIGHNAVQVLDGGFDAAVRAGFPTSSKTEMPSTAHNYPISDWKLPLADINAVENARQDAQCLVIDVRDKARFDGETEPIDLIAGHIPGAVNIPFTENLDADGFFHTPEVLREKYAKALGARKAGQVIVHCGSGVTACHTLLAMAYAGLEIPKLYVGSWSEWSRNERPMATKTNV
jgi:thiosulfate/3-mercaptopyruvate sulfurtransferase